MLRRGTPVTWPVGVDALDWWSEGCGGSKGSKGAKKTRVSCYPCGDRPWTEWAAQFKGGEGSKGDKEARFFCCRRDSSSAFPAWT